MRPETALPEIAVLADDLTGALASATRLRARGLRTVVEYEIGQRTSAAEAIVVNLGTREHHAISREFGTDPGIRVRAEAKNLRNDGCRRFELRIDSTFRGDSAAELQALCEGSGLGGACVLVVAAHPEAGRITLNGKQICFSEMVANALEFDVAHELFPHDPVTLLPLSDVRAGAAHLAQSMLKAGAADGARLVADAATTDDLATLSQAVGQLEDQVEFITVSPGAWLQFHPVNLPVGGRFVVIAVGTSTEINDKQLLELKRQRPVQVVSAKEAMCLVLEREELSALLSRAPTLVIRPDETRKQMSDRERVQAAGEVAVAVQAVLATARRMRFRCQGVVASGAFTGQRVAGSLGAQLLNPVDELFPLGPVGTLAGGGWSGLTLALKGGLVGPPDALVSLLDYMWKQP